ncbi:MBOAT family O-acyltransferase [Planococcus kocurii]|uniref:MBOAT family O-acyltransferase n=1 Tax=Planococcus kocurii TaxID=1374 RepID=UPI003CFF57AC
MTFISIEFLLFFAGIVFTYYLIPHKWRWILLLAASYSFYATLSGYFVLLLVISTVFTYFTGIVIEKQETKQQKKRAMLVGICVLLFFLGWFKYFNFVNDSIRAISTYMNWNYAIPYQEIILPLAISFYTFQAVSYLVDISRGKQKAERHYGYFSIYFAFFPQLVAGPIERAKKLLPQFKVEQTLNYNNISYGMKRIAWGFFKKTLIADRLAPIVASVYDSPDPTGSQIVLATILFSVQLYADFSALSDIAIGCARMLGIRLTENFKQPHFATSIGDFWNRWHITLSTWLRDYIFMPLCKGKKKRSEIYVAIIITFLISGVWHGAAWTFVLWGLIHGFYRAFGDHTKHFRGKMATFIHLDQSPSLHKWMKITTTFLLVCFSRVFFRSDSVTAAFENAQQFLSPSSWSPSRIIGAFEMFSLLDLMIFSFFFIVMQLFHYIERNNTSTWNWLSQRPAVARFAVYVLIVVSVLVFGATGQGFVYGGF